MESLKKYESISLEKIEKKHSSSLKKREELMEKEVVLSKRHGEMSLEKEEQRGKKFMMKRNLLFATIMKETEKPEVKT